MPLFSAQCGVVRLVRFGHRPQGQAGAWCRHECGYVGLIDRVIFYVYGYCMSVPIVYAFTCPTNPFLFEFSLHALCMYTTITMIVNIHIPVCMRTRAVYFCKIFVLLRFLHAYIFKLHMILLLAYITYIVLHY